MSGCTHVVYKRLAYLLSLKRGVPYCSVMAWLRCCISFSLLHSAIDCLRGACSHAQSAIGLLILPKWKVKCLSLNYTSQMFVLFSLTS